MNKEAILDDLQHATNNLLDLIAQFTVDTFNHKPSAEEWSAAQVAEHLLKVDITTNKALQSETIPTNRPPDQKIALIKAAMKDDTKRVAPERVLPSGEAWEPEAIRKQLQKQMEMMKEHILVADMTEACSSFKHPALGTMTKLEWVYFHIYHAERHVKQMERLREKTL